MKRTAAIVLLLAAAVAAHAGELIDPSGNFVGGLPGRIVADGVVISPVTLADALANGYREPTQADYDARDAANALASEQAAAMAGPDPELFVPALDENGNKVGTARIVVRAATWEVVPLTNEASPKRIWVVQRDEYKSGIARADAVKNKIKSEKGKGNGNAAVLGRISALEASQGVE